MRGADLDPERKRVEEEFGPWTAHSIQLGADSYTFEPWFDTRLRRVVQAAADILGKSFGSLRVLDLACLEGQLGIEFALQGAEVTAIEGRKANLAKAQFAKEALGLDRLSLELGDVRDLSLDRHGAFDVVVCAGILYHLDAPDSMDLIQSIADVCRGIAIVDTHISLSETSACEWRGRTYHGSYRQEHSDSATAEEVEGALWHSIDNRRVFLLTRDSLCNLLRHAGFTSVFECLVPYEAYFSDWPSDTGSLVELPDRVMLVAVRGEPRPLKSSEWADGLPWIDRPERSQVLGRPGIFERIGRRADRAMRKLSGAGRGKQSQSGLLSGKARPLWVKRS